MLVWHEKRTQVDEVGAGSEIEIRLPGADDVPLVSALISLYCLSPPRILLVQNRSNCSSLELSLFLEMFTVPFIWNLDF
jgi:hypothetical protein